MNVIIDVYTKSPRISKEKAPHSAVGNRGGGTDAVLRSRVLMSWLQSDGV